MDQAIYIQFGGSVGVTVCGAQWLVYIFGGVLHCPCGNETKQSPAGTQSEGHSGWEMIHFHGYLCPRIFPWLGPIPTTRSKGESEERGG